MSRFANGWFRLDRRDTWPDRHSNPFCGDYKLLATWTVINGWANYLESSTLRNGQPVVVGPGELLTSYADLGAFTGISVQSTRTCIDKLVRLGKISILSNRGGLHVRINDYSSIGDEQQDVNRSSNTGSTGDQQAINRRSTGDQQRTGEGKKRRREDGKTGRLDTAGELLPTFSPEELDAADRWRRHCVEQAPWMKPTQEDYAAGIVKLKRVMDLNDVGITAILDFIGRDDFWRKQALSPHGLWKKSERNGLRKIDNLLLALSKSTAKDDGFAKAARDLATGNYKDPFDDANYR